MLLYNSRLQLFLRTLRSKWLGPFLVIHVFPDGAIELEIDDGSKFKVNGQRLKLYFRDGLGVAMIEVIYLNDA